VGVSIAVAYIRLTGASRRRAVLDALDVVGLHVGVGLLVLLPISIARDEL